MKHIVVIGGGVAGLEASKKLSEMGHAVSIVEQTGHLGGKLNQWDTLFPDNRSASELLQKLQSDLKPSIQKNLTTKVLSVKKNKTIFNVLLSNGAEITADAILISTGFELFRAQKKEEYGYGIYDNVITSADLEELWRKGEQLKTSSGNRPKRVGIIHCVGSRDEKAGNTYCSKVCCITAVKQSIEIKDKMPDSEVFCFYMDLRMYGRNFEDIYRKAQVDYGIQFIRGRLSETFENPDSTIMLKVEDTLLGKPLRLNVDIVVLMVGMVPSASSKYMKELVGIETGEDGFLNSLDPNYDAVNTNMPGIFVAGACTGPKTINNTINEARAAAVQINEFVNAININE